MQQSPDSTPALGDKPYRPHPAEPSESPADAQGTRGAAPGPDPARPPAAARTAAPASADPLVPLSTRVPASLYKRLRITAFEATATHQELVTQALHEHLDRIAPEGGADTH